MKRRLEITVENPVLPLMTLNDLSKDMVRELGQWMTAEAGLALACTSKQFNFAIDDNYWEIKRTHDGIEIEEGGTTPYYKTNGAIMLFCSRSHPCTWRSFCPFSIADHKTCNRLFREDYADPHYICEASRQTPLIVASRRLCLPLVQYLVEQGGAAVHLYCGDEEYSPILGALSASIENLKQAPYEPITELKIRTIKYLMQRGANINHTTSLNTTYLHHAARLDPSVIPFLLDSGLSPFTRSFEYGTPMAVLKKNNTKGQEEACEKAMAAISKAKRNEMQKKWHDNGTPLYSIDPTE
jgi:hypothetical protein